MLQSVYIFHTAPFCLHASPSSGVHADVRLNRAGGFTLVEVLVVVCLLGIAVAMPGLSLLRALDRVQARNTAQVLQGSITQAQMDAVRLGLDGRVLCTERSLQVGPEGATFHAPISCPSPETNVSRWRAPQGGVSIGLVSPFGSPDSAGSVIFLPGGGGVRVVVRMASGLTRRDVP